MPHADHNKRVSEKCFLLNVFIDCKNNRARGDAQVNSAAPVGYALAMSVGTYLQTGVRTGGRHVQQSKRMYSAALLYRGAKPSTRFALELSMKALRGALVSALQRVKQTTNKAGDSNRLLAMAQRGLLQSIFAGSIPSTCQKRVRLRRGRHTALAALAWRVLCNRRTLATAAATMPLSTASSPHTLNACPLTAAGSAATTAAYTGPRSST